MICDTDVCIKSKRGDVIQVGSTDKIADSVLDVSVPDVLSQFTLTTEYLTISIAAAYTRRI